MNRHHPLQWRFAPERRALQALIDETQTFVNGDVRLKLYKGNVTVVGRRSDDSLFDESIATFEDDAGAYDQSDAEGFIFKGRVAIDGEAMTPATVLTYLNKVGGANAVGRVDIVENRFVGMKSRGCYETPGGTIMLKAHRAIESITLDREAAHLKDSLIPKYAEVIYNGYWFAPERRALQALIDETQTFVNGDVRLKLYKGNVTVVGRRSDDSLFDESIATFEDDAGAYDQSDAEGFIKLNALRLRIAASRGRSQL